MTDHKNALSSGTVLDNRYRLEAVLGAGGFGIVYRASQTHLGTQHAIKEYLPQEIALREGTTVHALSSKSREDYEEGLARFLSEARQLVPFADHPNIVNCTDFFEANGTAYLVMQYEDGLALDELAAAREQNGEPFEEDEIVGLMYPLLRGLQVVHEANVLHRDIKLGNIFIRRADEQPVLLDFGAAKQEFSKHSKSRGSPHTPGYAAMEQVEEEGQLGPWTDIHAVGAVFYRLMTGEVPVKSESRTMRLYRGQADPVQEGLDKLKGEGRFSAPLIETVRTCLAVKARERVPSVMDLLLRLDCRSSGGQRQGPESGTAPESSMSELEASNIPGLHGKMRDYLDAALSGDAHAQFEIGMWCAWNSDVSAREESKALYWLEKSAAGGFTEAYEEIGECYINMGMPDKAIKPLEIASEQGLHGATYNLAHLHLEGKGVIKDVRKAIQYLKKIRDAKEEWSDSAIEDLASIESDASNSDASSESGEFNESGQDITLPLLVDPELARTGGVKKITFPLPTRCTVCGGDGFDFQSVNICRNCEGLGWRKEEKSWKIRIGKGVKSGERYRFRGKGEPGRNGGQDGDLYFLIEVARGSSSASRELREISYSIDIEPDLASQGGTTLITLPLPEECGNCSGTGRNKLGSCRYCRGEGSTTIERSYKVNIPAGTRDHQKIRLSDVERSGRFGNQVGSILLDIRIAEIKEGDGTSDKYQKKSIQVIAKSVAKAVAKMSVMFIYMMLVMWFWVSLSMGAYMATTISAMLIIALMVTQKILLPKIMSARSRLNILKKAEQGDVNAQYEAGLIYCFGREIPKDYAEAFGWFRRAAEGGNENAQYNLAVLYMNGNGVRQNNFEAVRWLRCAADKGNDDAQFALGVLYNEGSGGLKKDITQAARWYQKAAKQGNAKAEDNLGKIIAKEEFI